MRPPSPIERVALMLQEFSLTGKMVLVAGGSWLQDLARPLAQAGAKLALLRPAGLSPDVGATELGGGGTDPSYALSCSPFSDSIEDAIALIEREVHPIDVFVCSTFIELAKPALDTSDEELDAVLNKNLVVPFYCCRAVGRRMVARKRGTIVNVVSGLAERGMSNASATCASMSGLQHLTRALAVEWAREGVRSNCLSVGWMDRADRNFSIEGLQKFIPARRFGQPEDIEGALVYLCSDASTLMTGQTLYVDGGVGIHA